MLHGAQPPDEAQSSAAAEGGGASTDEGRSEHATLELLLGHSVVIPADPTTARGFASILGKDEEVVHNYTSKGRLHYVDNHSYRGRLIPEEILELTAANFPLHLGAVIEGLILHGHLPDEPQLLGDYLSRQLEFEEKIGLGPNPTIEAFQAKYISKPDAVKMHRFPADWLGARFEELGGVKLGKFVFYERVRIEEKVKELGLKSDGRPEDVSHEMSRSASRKSRIENRDNPMTYTGFRGVLGVKHTFVQRRIDSGRLSYDEDSPFLKRYDPESVLEIARDDVPAKLDVVITKVKKHGGFEKNPELEQYWGTEAKRIKDIITGVTHFTEAQVNDLHLFEGEWRARPAAYRMGRVDLGGECYFDKNLVNEEVRRRNLTVPDPFSTSGLARLLGPPWDSDRVYHAFEKGDIDGEFLSEHVLRLRYSSVREFIKQHAKDKLPTFYEFAEAHMMPPEILPYVLERHVEDSLKSRSVNAVLNSSLERLEQLWKRVGLAPIEEQRMRLLDDLEEPLSAAERAAQGEERTKKLLQSTLLEEFLARHRTRKAS